MARALVSKLRNAEIAARAVVGLLSTLLLLLLAWAVVGRLGYPFALEWMEGAMVDHVARVVRGQPLYVPPSLEFVPFVYPPVYYLASAGVSLVAGIGYVPLRLVSVIATFANLGWVYAFVSREGKGKLAGVAAAGFFAGTYPLSGFWFDIGRVDSLFVCTVLAAAYCVRFGGKWVSVLGGASLVALGFFTKQAALVMVVPLGVYLVTRTWRRGLAFVAVSVVVVLAASIAIDSVHHGWFGYYTHRVPAGHPLAWDGTVPFLRGEVLYPCGLALAVSAFFWLSGLPGARARPRWFYGAMLLGMLAMAWMGRLHTGGWINVLMPLHAGIAIVFGLGLRASGSMEGMDGRLPLLVAGLSAIQLASMVFDPRSAIPTESDRIAGQALVQRLRHVPGPVWTTHRGYLAKQAGKEPRAHMMAMHDVMRSSADFAGAKQRLASEVRGALDDQKFDLVLLDNRDFWFLPALERRYVPDHEVWFSEPVVFWPRTGAHLRPELGYVRRPR